MQFNNPAALHRAKKNIEQLFPAVGILERLDETILLMEKRMPILLNGLIKDYQEGITVLYSGKNIFEFP